MANKRFLMDDGKQIWPITRIDCIFATDNKTFLSEYIANELSKKSNTGHTHDDRYYTESEINTKFNTVNKTISDHVSVFEAYQTTVTNALNGKANSSHGTHVTYATDAPKANGTASAGSANNVARGDHVHPLQTSVSGNAGSANKVNNSMKVQLNGGTTEGTNQFTFDGSAAKTINITPSSIGAAASSHGTHLTLGTGSGNAYRGDYGDIAYNHSQAAHAPSDAQKNSDITKAEIEAKLTGTITTHAHNYAGSSSAGGAATSANKVNSSLTVKLNSGTTEGTNLFTFNGSGAKTIDITPSTIGASPSGHNHDDRYYTESEIDTKLSGKANSSHGNHVPATQTANNAVFLRNDNTWTTVTPANIGAAAASHGTHVTYATSTPKANGTAAIGSSGEVARADHVHPLQTTVSGNAGSANKVNNNLVVKLNGGTTEGTNMFTFNGSAGKTINITPDLIGVSVAGHNHDDRYYTESEIDTKVNDLKGDMNSISGAVMGLVEDEEERALAAEDQLQTSINNEATNRENADTALGERIDGVVTALEGKANSSHGTHVTWAINVPKADSGSGSVGTVNRVAREDHVHPLQTTVSGNAGSANKVNNSLKVQLNGGTTEGTNQFTFDGSAAKTVNITPSSIGAAAAHNHDAYVNKNAFANITVGSTTIAADAVQDTLTIVAGSNITLTPDATNDKLTIAAKDTVYTHPSSHDASMITQSANYRFVTDTEKATWNAKSNLALGTTSSTAFRGDQGLTAYNHSQAAHAPSNAQKNSDITKAEIEAKLTGLITSHTHNYLPTTTIADNIDLNTLTTTGHYVLKGSGCTNAPATGNATVYVDFTVGTPYQLFMHDATFKLWYRNYNKTNSAWNAWSSTLGNSISGNAATATKVNNNMIVKLNGGTTEGTNLFTFNGSAAKTINITPSAIGASASGHNHDDRYYTESEVNTKIQEAKTYADTAVSNLVNSAPEAMNTLKELADAIDAHQDVYEAYVEEMTTALAGKANSSHGTHVTYSTSAPAANGTASAGSANNVARGDHVHPLQTTISGNAGSASKVNNNLVVKLNGGSTEGTNLFTFNGSAAKTVNITPSAIGAAPTSHASTATTYGVSSASNYGHAMASSTTPKANGTAAVGSETAKFARGDHVHPLQTTVSGNAGTATKLATARSITIGNKANNFDGSGNISYTLADMGATETVAWNCPITCATWSRLFQFTSSNATTGGTYLVNIRATRSSVVYNPTLLVNFSHSSKCKIVQLNNTEYSNIKVRGVVNSDGAGYFEMYDNVNSATNSTTQTVSVTVTKISSGLSITKYTAFTTGATVPSGYSSQGEITTVSGTVYTGKASTAGTADSATQFSANKSVTLTGDVTGTASSKAGWSVATTLANSGVTAGNYGPSANASPAHSGTFNVPYITVDAKGRVTSAATRTITLPADNNTWRGIQNNLTSDSTTDSLAAAQGKALKALIDGKANSSHNHTSLTGITSLAFATDSSDSASISRTVDGTNTYIDFNLSDDASQNDMWRWRFTPSGGTLFNAMTLDPTSLTEAKLTVTGNVSATSFTENGVALSTKYAAASHGTHLTLGTGSGNAFRGDYGNTAYTHSQAAHAPSNAQKNSDITKAEIEAKLTGTIATHTHNTLTAASGTNWTGTAVPNTTDCAVKFYSHISKSATGLFPNGDNSNAMISINRHDGNYDSQLGFSSNGNLYYRSVDGTAMTDSTAWKQIAFTNSSITGNAATATKVNNSLSIQLNGGTATTFDGSAAKSINITPSSIGAAASSHGTHVTYSTTAPAANGTASAGSAANVSRGDHVHPLQTTVSGNAGTATKLQTTRTLTIGNAGKTFDGSANVSWTLGEIGAIPLTGNTGAYSITGNLEFSDAGTSGGFKGVVGKCGTNDYWRVGGLGIASNDGRMEIATSDDGNEPIYVRQYSGVYSTLVRSATLLDASGNTSFPGSVAVGNKVQMQYNATSESLDFIFI